MAAINYGRVLAGGLAAGVVANIVDFVSAIVLSEDLARMAQGMAPVSQPPPVVAPKPPPPKDKNARPLGWRRR